MRTSRRLRVGGLFHQLRARVVVERRVVGVPADHVVAHQTRYESVAVVDQHEQSKTD
jgi:hypothetical protein